MMEAARRKLGASSERPIEVEGYLYDSVDVNPEALEEEMVRAPADLAYWNERHAQAHRASLTADLDLERTEARLTLEHREKLTAAWQASIQIDDKGKKLAGQAREPAEAQVKAAVSADPEYQRARLAALEAEVEKARVRGVVSAVEAKRDMVQSINATRRMEMSDPLLRAAVAAGRR